MWNALLPTVYSPERRHQTDGFSREQCLPTMHTRVQLNTLQTLTLYPTDFSSFCEQGRRSIYLYRSITNAVSLPSASYTTEQSIYVKQLHLTEPVNFYLNVSISIGDLRQKKFVQFFLRFLPQLWGWCGKKSVVCVAQCVAALILVQGSYRQTVFQDFPGYIADSRKQNGC